MLFKTAENDCCSRFSYVYFIAFTFIKNVLFYFEFIVDCNLFFNIKRICLFFYKKYYDCYLQFYDSNDIIRDDF